MLKQRSRRCIFMYVMIFFYLKCWAEPSLTIELWNHCFWNAHTPVEGRAQSGCCNHVTPSHFCQFLPEKCWLCFLSGFDIFRSRCCCSLWVGDEAADISCAFNFTFVCLNSLFQTGRLFQQLFFFFKSLKKDSEADFTCIHPPGGCSLVFFLFLF